MVLVESGTTLTICATGAKLAPTGVEGEMRLTGFIKNTLHTDWWEVDEKLIFKAGLYFDSPLMSNRNRFNYTVAKESSPKLKLWCRDDFNRKGGALGNVDCYLEGTFRQIKQESLPVSEPEPVKAEEVKPDVHVQLQPTNLTEITHEYYVADYLSKAMSL